MDILTSHYELIMNDKMGAKAFMGAMKSLNGQMKENNRMYAEAWHTRVKPGGMDDYKPEETPEDIEKAKKKKKQEDEAHEESIAIIAQRKAKKEAKERANN